MKTSIVSTTAVVCAVVLSAFASGGCELVAYVDRAALDAEQDAGAGTTADAGATTPACTSPSQCAATGSECIEATCDQGRCGTRIKKGDTCSTGVCDLQGKCLPPSCLDRVKNNAETDIDCGGRLCPPCADYMSCAQGSDCASKVCDSLSHTCGG